MTQESNEGKGLKILDVIILIIVLGFGAYLIFVVDVEEILNPPLNAGCDTQEECYYRQGALCQTYNTDGKNCVREGYTGTGFLGLTDFNQLYYVCEGFGRMARSCENYYTWEEFDKHINSQIKEQIEEGEA